MTWVRSILPSCIGVAALLSLAPVSARGQAADPKAPAQEDAPAEQAAAEIEDIVITVQCRETNLQTTAGAITALSEADLLSRSVEDVQDLGILSPSMDVSLYQGEAQIYIRGIGYTGLIGGTDSSTAFHSNGVYLSRSSSAVPGFFDVDRVEILRGPQGTLYGRNATGGSVNVISKGPTDELKIDAMATLGNFDHYALFGAIGGPIAGGDRVTARLAVRLEQRDGFTQARSASGSRRDIEDQRDVTARLSVRVRATDDLEFDLSGDYYEADDASSIWLYLGPGTGTNPFLRNYIAAEGGVPPNEKSRKIGSDVKPLNKPLIWGLTGRATWSLGEYTLTSLTGYRKTRPYNFNDLDVTISNAITQLRSEDHEQISEELQFVSPGGEDLEWIVGAYYFHETNDVRNEYEFPFIDEMFALPSDPTCCRLRLDGRATTRASAIFGEANYDVTDRINLVLGGRYSWERRAGRNDVEFVNFLTPLFDNQADFEPKTFSSFTPKFGVDFSVSEDLFAYASVSRGFKSGGFNIGSYQNDTFDPEKIWSYELGLKADLLDQRLRLNLAAFYYDYADLQVQDVEGNNTVVRNAANARIMGIELEGTALVTPALQIDLNATYLDAEFRNTCLADPKFPLPLPESGCTEVNQQNLAGNQLPRAPKFKTSLGAQYTQQLGDLGELVFRSDYVHQARVYYSAFEVGDLSQKAHSWLKARVTYVHPDGHWTLAAFIDNATDERVISNATYIADIVDSTITGNMAPPRTYGAQLQYEF